MHPPPNMLDFYNRLSGCKAFSKIEPLEGLLTDIGEAGG